MARNADMVEYNIMLRTAVSARSNIEKMQKTKVDMQQGRLNNEKNTTQDLDTMTKLLERIFDTSRARVMRLLSLLQRSLAYRALTLVDFRDEASNSQSVAGRQEAALSMTSFLLRDMRMKLSDQLFDVQELQAGDRSLFPSNFEKGIGFRHQLSAEDLATLLQTRSVQVVIPWEGASEFRGLADVRIYRVRFWMRGLKVRGSAESLSESSVAAKGHDDKLFGGSKVVTTKLTHTGSLLMDYGFPTTADIVTFVF